jgi:hypothetical protein
MPLMIRLEGKTILFSTVAEYLDEYRKNITQGGFFVESNQQLAPRSKIFFGLTIGTTDTGLRLTAEVVWSDGKRVGLQIPAGSAEAQALARLSDELRQGGSLQPNGTIVYPSLTALLLDFEFNIATGGFYVNASDAWPEGQTQTFTLQPAGAPSPHIFQAKIVSAQAGMVGLQLVPSRENIRAFNQYVVMLRTAHRAAVAEAESRLKLEERPASGRALVSFQGLVVASADPEEFRAIRVRRGLSEGVTLSVFELVVTLARARQPIKLLVEANGQRFTFWFDAEGLVVALEGQKTDVEFLDRLVEAGFIDQPTRDGLKAELGGSKDARSLAVSRGVIGEQQALIALRDQLVDALEYIRARGQCRFVVDTEVRVPERPAGVPLEKLILPWLERALKALPAATIQEMLKPIWASSPRPVKLAEWELEKLDLPDEEYRFVRSLDGSLALKNALAGLDKKIRDRCTRLTLSLLSLGTLEAEGWGKRAGPAPASKPQAAAGAVDLDSLREEIAQLEQGNLFDQLGVHWSAHPKMFALAMQEINRNYGTESDLYQSGPQAAELCRKRLQLARQALLVLQDAAKRVEHRNQQVPVALRCQSAKLMVQKAEKALAEQQPREALDLLEMACELDPRPEYRTRLKSLQKFIKA